MSGYVSKHLCMIEFNPKRPKKWCCISLLWLARSYRWIEMIEDTLNPNHTLLLSMGDCTNIPNNSFNASFNLLYMHLNYIYWQWNASQKSNVWMLIINGHMMHIWYNAYPSSDATFANPVYDIRTNVKINTHNKDHIKSTFDA